MMMKVKEVIEKLDLEVITASDLKREVKGGYTGDLLSNVMAQAEANDLWITIQGHQNVVAVALLVDMAAIIIAEDFEIEDKAINRAREKDVNILRSPLSAFELSGRLFEMGVTS